MELGHGAAVILLLVYASYLLFQLKTHSDIYNGPSEKSPRRNHVKPAGRSLVNASASVSHAVVMGTPRPEGPTEVEEGEPVLTLRTAAILLVACAALMVICSECLLNSIEHLVTSGVNRVSVGLILLPIVGNAIEHATAGTVAVKDKIDHSIDLAVGSSCKPPS